MIEFKDVTKKFPDGTVAVNQANFIIDNGEFVFFIGPSGAGKTTIFRLLIRDYLPTSGDIFVDNHRLEDLRATEVTQLRRKIGVVFQDLKLINEKSVFENVALSLEVLGKNKKEILLEVEEKLRLVDMWEHRDYMPIQLSGGEAQRVVIARAIVGHPAYLLADEPTGDVDRANGWAIMKILDTINKQGTTVIVATHDAEIVNAKERRVIKIDDGHILLDKKGKYHD